MKNRPPLTLMEQMVMLLVFALAAALCLQAFVKSDEMSRRSQARDQALTAAQTVAETVRHCQGDMARAAALLGVDSDGADSLSICYDEDWNFAQGTMRYMLGIARQDSGVDGLGMAQVWIVETAAEKDGPEELVRFDVAWQEVSGGAQ